MQQSRHVIILAFVLMAAGASLFAYKATRLGIPVTPGIDADIWTVEARISFVGEGGPVKAAMRIPAEPPGFGILNENFVSRGFGLSTSDIEENREAMWTRRRARGPQALYYRVTVYRDSGAEGRRRPPDFPPVPELEEPFATALLELVGDARQRSADIVSFTSQMLRRLSSPTPDENVALFIDRRASALEKARVAQTLLAGARIPTQIAHGIQLRGDAGSLAVRPWLEVHNGSRWLYFDPSTGESFRPDDFLTWYYGDGPLVNIENAREVESALSLRREVVDSIAIAERRAVAMGSHAFEFSLFDLPIRTQGVYSVLLMIPVGALVMVFMRNVVGVPTFGTFTPILVALAFRETALLYGAILFVLVVGLGLTARFYLEKLRLLLVPRLAAVLTVVVILLLVISIVSHRLDLEMGLSVALFPMVILTMVIERMSIVWDERGPADAFAEGVGSLVVAVLAYIVMSVDQLEHLMFVFPELLLVLLGLYLLLGRYTGYRLSELLRFSALVSKRDEAGGS